MPISVVTGGTGFIGSALSLKLQKKGHQVKIYDNLSTGMSSLLEGNEDLFDIIIEDILDFKKLRQAFEGADFIFHNAAMRSVPLSIKEPVKTSNANILGTLNVLEAARQCNVKKVVLASSSSVYGRNKPPFTEDMELQPLSFYSSTKISNEHHALLYYKLYGLETISLRYFNVFGPGQNGINEFSPAVPRFIHLMSKAERPIIFGDGEQSRDFTFIDNVIEANLLAMDAKHAAGKAFNVAQGESHSMSKLVKVLNGLLGTDAEPIYEEARMGDVRHTQANLSLAEKVLGYRPRISFKDGLKLTVEYENK